MSPSRSKDKPGNQYVISAQLDPESHAKLMRMIKESGMSKSRIIRILIMGASVKRSTKLVDGDGDE